MIAGVKLRWIKLLHTLIWLFFNAVIFYMAYAVAVNKIDLWLWICYGLIILEGITLSLFSLYCPITIWARKYSESDKPNFDIYLPEWLAKYNKHIYTTIVAIITVVLVFRLIQDH